jgi:outer membrane immunogenic protein
VLQICHNSQQTLRSGTHLIDQEADDPYTLSSAFREELKMRKLLTGLIASVAFGAISLGITAQEARAEHAATHDWTGPYIGAIVGVGSYEGSVEGFVFDDPGLEYPGLDYPGFDYSGPMPFNSPLADSGFLGGLTVGWSGQSGHIVYGLEGDVSFGEVSGGTTGPMGGIYGGGTSFNGDLFATVRGRVGFAANDLLLYGTAGLAILDGSVSNGGFGGGQVGETAVITIQRGRSYGFTATGAVVGAGAELAITEALSFKAELLYAFFDEDVRLGLDQEDAIFNLSDFYTVRVGLNWNF